LSCSSGSVFLAEIITFFEINVFYYFFYRVIINSNAEVLCNIPVAIEVHALTPNEREPAPVSVRWSKILYRLPALPDYLETTNTAQRTIWTLLWRPMSITRQQMSGTG